MSKRADLNRTMSEVNTPSNGAVTLSGAQVEALTKAITMLADEAITGNRIVRVVAMISLLGFFGSLYSVNHVSKRFDEASEDAQARMALFETQRTELLTAARKSTEESRKAVRAAREAAAQSAEAAAEAAEIAVRLAPQRERPALQVRAARKKAKARALSQRY